MDRAAQFSGTKEVDSKLSLDHGPIEKYLKNLFNKFKTFQVVEGKKFLNRSYPKDFYFYFKKPACSFRIRIDTRWIIDYQFVTFYHFARDGRINITSCFC